MTKKFKIDVNDIYQFDLDTQQVVEMNCIEIPFNTYHVIDDNKAYKAKILHADFQNKTYTICINGNSYAVSIKDELDGLIKELGLGLKGKQIDTNITAPMPGLILEIRVKPGQEVKEGEALLVLEAMKMENIIIAPNDCIIKSVAVKKGEAVDKKQLLIEIEEHDKN